MTVIKASFTKKKRNYPERDLQKSCLQWFRLQYPIQERLSFSTMNGVHIGAWKDRPWLGKLLKAEGFKKGIPDWICLVPSKQYHGLIIEFKHTGNKTTREQSEILSLLKSHVYYAETCYSFDDFQKIVTFYFGGELSIANSS